jgi:hypothetical protein
MCCCHSLSAELVHCNGPAGFIDFSKVCKFCLFFRPYRKLLSKPTLLYLVNTNDTQKMSMTVGTETMSTQKNDKNTQKFKIFFVVWK